MKKIILMMALLISGFVSAKNVDLAKSQFEWKGTKVKGEHFGKIKLKSGNLDFTKGKISGGKLVMDMNSMDVTDLNGE